MPPLSKEAATARFALLGLMPSFDMDDAALEASYFKQQRLFHPDRTVGKPPLERQAALQRSVDINEAYQALKTPLSRAQTLLAMQGLTVGTDTDSVKPTQSLLMETLSWRETIDESATPQALETTEKSLSAAHLHCLAQLSTLYRDQNWQAMAQSALRLGYIEKALQAAAQTKKRMDKTVP